MKAVLAFLLPRPFRFSLWRPAAVLLAALSLVEIVLLFAFGKTVPDAKLAADAAYFLAQLSAFLVPFAYFLSCMRREPVPSLCPVVGTLYNYVLPVLVIQMVYALPAGVPGAVLNHALVLSGMVFAVWGVDSFLRAAGLTLDLRRLAVLVLLLVAMLDVILFNTVVERAGGARDRVISLILTANPGIITASAFEKDVLRGPLLYHRSVIGQYYPFEYPEPLSVFLKWLLFGVALTLLGLLLETLARSGRKARSP